MNEQSQEAAVEFSWSVRTKNIRLMMLKVSQQVFNMADNIKRV